MQSRRSILATLASTPLVSLPGCPLLSDTIEAKAKQAEVTDSGLTATGYQHERTSNFEVEETIEVRDTSRKVRLTNWIAVYTNLIKDQPLDAAQFSVVTSPTVSVAGQDVNPLERFDDERLLNLLIGQLGLEGVQDVREVGSRPVVILEESTTITLFEATTKQQGIDLNVHLGYRTHEGDFLIVVGAHPKPIDESGNVDILAGHTDHPV